MIKVIAHRGTRAKEPENTIRGIKRAFTCRADAVEIDVRLSKDGKVMVIHDETLERTTNGVGSVREKRSAELKLLDAGKGEEIPILSEVLSLSKGFGIELVVEMKEEGIEERVMREIEDLGMDEEEVTISSFFHPSLLKIKELEPKIKTGVIISSLPVFPVNLARDANANVIFPKYPRLNGELVEKAHKNGIDVYPWVINRKKDLEKVIELGVDGIVTDDPCLIRRLIKDK
jgi:glycerophosphoryl diester phosphodiesterase